MKLKSRCEEGRRVTTRWKVLPTLALFWALLWSPSETFAQDTSGVTDGVTTEVVQKEKKWVDVHGMVQVWSWVAWDYAQMCTDKAALTAVLDVSHQKTWLGFTAVRLDDFHDDPAQPTSKATVLNTHWSKTFWKDGQRHLGVDGKYTFIDHLPQANWFSPDVVWSYSTKDWWAFEWMYGHKFKDGKDSDAFRLSVSKKIDEALKLTAQWWYETWYDKHFYGRVLLDVDLWSGFGAQLSCIAKDWKLTPTAWVMYKF